jgi:hypothetical protein
VAAAEWIICSSAYGDQMGIPQVADVVQTVKSMF